METIQSWMEKNTEEEVVQLQFSHRIKKKDYLIQIVNNVSLSVKLGGGTN